MCSDAALEPAVNRSVFIAYASEDRLFVEFLKKDIQHRNATVWVDWQNTVLFEKNLGQDPECVARIHREMDNAALIVFVISKHWVGKPFCMLELEWALERDDGKILPVLLDWTLQDARNAVASYKFDGGEGTGHKTEHHAGLLETLLGSTLLEPCPVRCARLPALIGVAIIKILRTVIVVDCRSGPDLTSYAAKVIAGRLAPVLQEAPSCWIDRPADLTAVLNGLGISESGEPPDFNSPGRFFALTGLSGVGKTAITKRLMDLTRPNYARPPVRVEVS
jgi:hypothetical protein